jgi:tryptophan synthase beta chain
MSPLISHLYDSGLIEAEAIGQRECFAAGVQFARIEGIVPAPEPTHALAATFREADKARQAGESTVILTALCGHGFLDLSAYEAFLADELADEDSSPDRFAASLAGIPAVPG